MHKFKLKYELKIETGEFSEEQIAKEIRENDYLGATDALVLTSVLKSESTGVSVGVFSFDGSTHEPTTNKELFKIWLLMGSAIADAPDLPEWAAQIANWPLQEMKKRIMEQPNDNT